MIYVGCIIRYKGELNKNGLGEQFNSYYFLSDKCNDTWQAAQQKLDFTLYNKTLDTINNHKCSTDFRLISIAAKFHCVAHNRGSISITKIEDIAAEYELQTTEAERKSVISFLIELGLISEGVYDR